MTVTFVHTADWQIGKPFRRFGERTAGVLENERLNVIERIAAAARAGGASAVLVAGDIYDSESIPDRTLSQPIARMAADPALRWHLLPGNHDPARAGGVWQRLARLGLPANVLAHTTPGVVDIAPGVALLPAPLVSRGPGQDPTAWMDAAETSPGTLRIGLAHGSVTDFGSGDGESAARIAPARARLAGLAYLALGDWHGVTRIDERTWYSGTPEPDRFPDNEPGRALLVRCTGSAPPAVERVATAQFTWAKRAVHLSGPQDLAVIELEASRIAQSPERLLLSLTLTGRLPLDALGEVDALRRRLEARLFHVEIDGTAVQVVAADDDIARLALDPQLAGVAAKLRGIAADPEDPRQGVAMTALARLATLAAARPEAAS